MDELWARAKATVEMIDATAGSRADDVEIIHDALRDAVEAERVRIADHLEAKARRLMSGNAAEVLMTEAAAIRTEAPAESGEAGVSDCPDCHGLGWVWRPIQYAVSWEIGALPNEPKLRPFPKVKIWCVTCKGSGATEAPTYHSAHSMDVANAERAMDNQESSSLIDLRALVSDLQQENAGLRAAVEAEREACARVAETMEPRMPEDADIAAAIRARRTE